MEICEVRKTLEDQLAEAWLEWYQLRDQLLNAADQTAATDAQRRVTHLMSALHAHCVKHACGIPAVASGKATLREREVVCLLWIKMDRRLRGRRYHKWKRPCEICRRHVVVSGEIETTMRSGEPAALICELCDLLRRSIPD